jgi:alkyl hydroperoxide reductase subunit AhpC
VSIQLGDNAPNFKAITTEGEIDFHEWSGDSWIILMSHPGDFTPVCTTELGRAASLSEEFKRRNAKTIAISVDGVDSHSAWIGDINETQNTKVNFPLIADPSREIATLYDMIHPNADNTNTVRTLFIIGPDKKVKLSLAYPPSTGRNFQEILRVLDSLQLTAHYQVATPADWNHGEDCVVIPAIKTEDISTKFPKGYTEIKPYLRTTPQPNI